MKSKLILFVFILITRSIGTSQTTLSSFNCNSLEVEIQEDIRTTAKVLLEQQYQKDIWMKIAETNTESNRAVFIDLDNGLYRATYVVYGSNWRSDKYISNTTEIKCGNKSIEQFVFLLSPNPSANEINVKILDHDNIEHLTYQVIDPLGNTVLKGSSINSIFQIDLNNISSGVYYLKVNINGKYSLKQFTVTK